MPDTEERRMDSDVSVADLLMRCAEEIEVAVEERYHADHPDGVHPAQEHRYERDMKPARRARRVAERLRVRQQKGMIGVGAARREIAHAVELHDADGEHGMEVWSEVSDCLKRAEAELAALCPGVGPRLDEQPDPVPCVLGSPYGGLTRGPVHVPNGERCWILGRGRGGGFDVALDPKLTVVASKVPEHWLSPLDDEDDVRGPIPDTEPHEISEEDEDEL